MAPTRWISILLAKAKAKVRASKVVARAFSKATRADGRVSRQVEEKVEVAREGAFMGIKVAREERVVLIVGRMVTSQPTAPFPKCATIVGAHTT